jgi:hypothetical protein
VPVGNVCPECGKPTGRAGRGGGSGRIVESLIDAPMWYLKSLARGTLLLSGVLFAMLLMWFGGRAALGRVQPWAPTAAWLTLSGLWWLGVFISTAPRVLTNPGAFNPKREWRRVRMVNRITQLFWGVAIVLGAVAEAMLAKGGGTATTGTMVVQIAAAAALLVALFGLVPLCVQLADLAEWAQDSPLSARFNTAGGAIAFGGAISVVIELTTAINPFWIMFKFISTMSLLLMVFGEILFFVNIFLFALMVMWAINNKENLAAVDERRAERDWLEAARQRELQRRMDQANREAGIMPVAAPVGEGDSIPLADDPGLKSKIKPEVKMQDRSITAPRNYATGGENRPRGDVGI